LTIATLLNNASAATHSALFRLILVIKYIAGSVAIIAVDALTVHRPFLRDSATAPPAARANANQPHPDMNVGETESTD
jgi:hypothetical protein